MLKSKALVLLSGGLDSMLAARLLQAQGIEVTGLTFISHFFGAKKARKVAEQLGIKLKEVDFKEEHLAMVKNPKYGYGKNMNPCIDCHALMLRHAKKMIEDQGYDFVATGEILDQRPMSQNKEALKIVAEYSGISKRLVRPMSAKLLEETEPEKEGKVIRGKLLDIHGRTREKQLELVKKYHIKEYSSAGSGCLLTDPGFSERLVKLFDYWPNCSGNDVELLKHGRISWLNLEGGKKVLLIVGRNKEDNENLISLACKEDLAVELKDIMGPTTIIRMQNEKCKMNNVILMEVKVPTNLEKSKLKLGERKNEEEILHIAAMLTGWYATKARGRKVQFILK